MRAKYGVFDVAASADRINEILDGVDAAYVDADSIPVESQLTLSNGFNVRCTALFIDIRGSSTLPKIHTRPVLAKLYRAYVSECIAVLNGSSKSAEIFIQGDCVSAIFDTPGKLDIDEVFQAAAKLNSLVNILNWKLARKGYTPIRCGIGLANGRALMVKTGHRGSAINEIAWMGNVVNEASHLCHKGNRDDRAVVQISKSVYSQLRPEYQKLMKSVYPALSFEISNYEATIVHQGMEAWLANERYKVRKVGGLAEFLFGGPKPPAPELFLSSLIVQSEQ